MDSDPPPSASSSASSPPYRPTGEKPRKRSILHLPGWSWRVKFLGARFSPEIVAIFFLILILTVLGIIELWVSPRAYALLAVPFVAAIFLLIVTRLVINGVIKESSEILFAPYGVEDENAAYELLYDYLVDRQAPLLILQKGLPSESTAASPLFKLGLRGPGFVRVDAHTALLLQKGNTWQVKRIGEHFFSKDERLRGWVDVSVQRYPFSLDHVYTKDNIPLCVKGTLYYRIFQSHDVLARRIKDLPLSTALRLALSLPKWNQTAEATADAKLRDLIAEFNLNDIHGTYPQAVKFTLLDEDLSRIPLPPATRTVVQERLDQVLNESLGGWGVEALKIVIHEITLPVEIEKTLRDAWATAWKNQIEFQEVDNKAKTKRRQAEAERDASDIKRIAEILKAQGEAESLRVTTTARTEATFEYMRRVEQFAKSNEIKLDTELMREMLRTARLMTERPRPKKKSEKAKSDLDGKEIKNKRDKETKLNAERDEDDTYEEEDDEE